MKVLLDTHILLWALANDEKLPNTARKIIEDTTNQVFYSAASLWEVSIKHASHPERMSLDAQELGRYCEKAGYIPLGIEAHHVETLETLRRAAGEHPHNDPFDRILIAQAKTDGLLFMTHDALIPGYKEDCILPV
jgi:PIN domain nuclease of toxin-antitoxin system